LYQEARLEKCATVVLSDQMGCDKEHPTPDLPLVEEAEKTEANRTD
jgi:hypothetical protein